jgi:hypothetical protein
MKQHRSLFAADDAADAETILRRLRKIIGKLPKDDIQTLLITIGIHPAKRKAEAVEQIIARFTS